MKYVQMCNISITFNKITQMTPLLNWSCSLLDGGWALTKN